MRDTTNKILALDLFKVVEIDVDHTDHWDDPDHITLLKNANAQIVLRITEQGPDVKLYSVCLEIDEFDSYGEIYLNDVLWSLFGNEDKIIAEIKLKDWSLKSLGAYNHHFK
ncbi:hypothetical protein NQ656_17545 [Acinetobacter baumannii]|nr:hypothetical protein [Acinetobacter baumannii]